VSEKTQQEIHAARYKARMEADFEASSSVQTEHRIASALEYIAYQLGQINRKIDGFNTSSQVNKDADEKRSVMDNL
jgi:hypothetical protein